MTDTSTQRQTCDFKECDFFILNEHFTYFFIYIYIFFSYPTGQAKHGLFYLMQHLQSKSQDIKIKLFKIWDVEYMEKIQSLRQN